MCSRGLEVDPSLWGGGEEKRKRGREVETGREGKRRLGEERRGEEVRRRLRGGGEEKSRG